MKHQRGIVGADLAAIAAKRNQTAQVRTAQRAAAIQKAKAEKKEKEAKKEKSKVRYLFSCSLIARGVEIFALAYTGPYVDRPTSFETADEGWERRSLRLWVPLHNMISSRMRFAMHNTYVHVHVRAVSSTIETNQFSITNTRGYTKRLSSTSIV